MPRSHEIPYWLAGGTERCELCMDVYVLQMEYRCVGCDRGVCDACAVVVWETREVFCTECRVEEAV